MRQCRTLAAVLSLLAIAAACTRQDSARPSRARVVASFYPLAFVAEEVAGDLAEVENLTPPGAEPHDLELTPGQVTAINQAGLVLYLGDGFQPSVEEAIAGIAGEAVDILEGQEALLPGGAHKEQEGKPPAKEAGTHSEEGPLDPHIWLDPQRIAEFAAIVGERLAKIDPGNARTFRNNATSLSSRLQSLDAEFTEGLAQCDRRSIVTSHEAFGYLAAAYDLEQIGIAGIDPESEPLPQRLAEVADFVRSNGVTTIYFEVLVSPALANTLAEETGATIAKLDPLEGPPKEGDYFTAMRANLEALKKSLGCR